ncbi:MAG: hypothetical protein WKG03_13990, partial [Telluria sp.]
MQCVSRGGSVKHITAKFGSGPSGSFIGAGPALFSPTRALARLLLLCTFACAGLPASAQAPDPAVADITPKGRFTYRSYGAELGLANV